MEIDPPPKLLLSVDAACLLWEHGRDGDGLEGLYEEVVLDDDRVVLPHALLPPWRQLYKNRSSGKTDSHQ